MSVLTFSDTEIVAAIKEGGRKRQDAIRFLYKEESLKNKIIQFVKRNNGNLEDGQDMFHEGIIVLDRNIRQDKFKQESSVQGYLFSICRFLWMNQIRKKSKMTYTEDNNALDSTETETPESHLFSNEQKDILRKLISHTGRALSKNIRVVEIYLILWKKLHRN